jgi:transcriptional regulator with XRE-family HTH domain
MLKEREKMVWWVELGYPPFEEEKDGFFPRTGQVVRHYREKKRDGGSDAWTQWKLAKLLYISEKAVRDIENRDAGIDIDRRQRLCQLLDIPPILLGIRTREEILRMVEQQVEKNVNPVGTCSVPPSVLWWVELGYPAFAPGKDGFLPRTGQVIKHYRGLKMDTKGKAWTQRGLALALNITEQAVRDLENKDSGMDFDRRQFLSKLFDIPPVLLGIRTREEILRIVEQERAAKARVVSTPISTSRKLLIDPKEYYKQLAVYWITNHSHTAYACLTDIFLRIDALYRELPHTRDKKPIQELLCSYHQFVAHLFRDQQMYDDAIIHLNKAFQFTKLLKNDELKALVLHRRGRTFENANRIAEAVQDYGEARRYEQRLPDYLNGAIFLHAGLVGAKDAKTDEQKRKQAIQLLDRGGNIIHTKRWGLEDPYFLDLNLDRYHLTRSAALIEVGRNNDAITDLKLVKCGSEYPRAQAYNDILEARAHLNLGEYSEAVSLAESGLVVVQGIKSKVNIARVVKIHEELQKSLFKNDPEFARLDYLLGKR